MPCPKGTSRRLLLLGTLSLGLCAPLPAQSNEELLPAGPLKTSLVKRCVGCHEMDLVVARRHTRAEWDGVMEDMLARGAEGTPAEISALAEYLSTYLGKVNINRASDQELAAKLKISAGDAAAIVAWRQKHGEFKNFDDVRSVPGLDAAKIGSKRGWIAFKD